MNKIIKLPSLCLLSHNGLGDMVSMIGAIHFLRNYYEKIYYICKYEHLNQVEYIYKNYNNIIIIPLQKDYNECQCCINILESKYNDSDILICGCHKEYLKQKITHPDIIEMNKNLKYEEYPSYCNIKNISTNIELKIPNFYWFIEMFYYDMGLPISVMHEYFNIDIDEEIINLYYNIKKFKIIFLHTSSSSHSIEINLDNYKNNKEYLIICVNKNYYDMSDENFEIANKYINLSTIFHYIEIIKNAYSIHVTDSCFSCLLLPLLKNNEIKSKDVNIYNRETSERINIDPIDTKYKNNLKI